jgi:multiple sugar transport system ATP-binding protein
MNFVPCHLDQAGSGLAIRVGGDLSLGVPAEREPRYRNFVGKEMLLGIRPEHVTHKHAHTHDAFQDFVAPVKVLEPMGIDTMVFFDFGATEVCSRSDPKAIENVGNDMDFTIDKSQMHLIDPQSSRVI